MASSIQYLTASPNGYIMPTDANSVDQLSSASSAPALRLQTFANGMQKLVSVQPMQGAAPNRAATPGGMYAPASQKVVLQPARTFWGTTYVHQATLQPRVQQLPPGTQIVNAFSADGQPITLAISPNGSQTILPTVQVPSSRPVSSQHVQFRQMPATTLLSQGSGQRIVQVSASDLQNLQSGGGTTLYKVVQQNPGMQPGDRFIVQAGPGQQVVQRLVPATATHGMAMKQATNVQPVAVRPAASVGTVVPSIQMGRSLIHMSARPSLTVTPAVANPNNVVTKAKVGAAKQVFKPLQQVQALPSSILVKQPDGGMPTNGSGLVVPAQSVQQQVKDTAAQQRQQQLLASLRARVASLQEVRAASAPSPHPGQVSAMLPNAGQVRRIVSVGDAGTHGAQPVPQQQSVDLTAQQLNLLGKSSGLILPGSNQVIDAQTFMAMMQQQGLLLGHGANKPALTKADSGQALLDPPTLAKLLQKSNPTLSSVVSDHQLLLHHQPMSCVNGAPASDCVLPSGHMLMMPNHQSGCGAPQSSISRSQTSLHSSVEGKITPPPSSPSNLAIGKGDLRAILYSIGFELARHGIDVQTAVDAGWLGVLSPADVAVLHEAYIYEEYRLLAEGTGQTNADVTHKSSGLTASIGAASTASRGSRGSPAQSIASGVGIAATDPVWSSIATEPPAQTTEIGEAHFSAFAYDFFGKPEGTPVGVTNFLEALEPENSLSRGAAPSDTGSARSSMANELAVAAAAASRGAPMRAPSWPVEESSSSVNGVFQADNESVASFSDTCTVGKPSNTNIGISNLTHCIINKANSYNHEATSDAVSSTSSNHELVARIANLDLGCGFY